MMESTPASNEVQSSEGTEEQSNEIFLITKECLLSLEAMRFIYSDIAHDYYCSSDWSTEFKL
jgi:hypothetical protein